MISRGRKKTYKRLEPAMAQLDIDRGVAKHNIKVFEKDGRRKEAQGNRRDVRSMDEAMKILRGA